MPERKKRVLNVLFPRINNQSVDSCWCVHCVSESITHCLQRLCRCCHPRVLGKSCRNEYNIFCKNILISVLLDGCLCMICICGYLKKGSKRHEKLVKKLKIQQSRITIFLQFDICSLKHIFYSFT